MAWTDPTTHNYSTGEMVTAATLDTFVRDNLAFLGNGNAIAQVSGATSPISGSSPGVAAGTKFLIQGGSKAITSNASGDCSITLDTAFPTGLLVAVITNGDYTVGVFYMHMNTSSSNASTLAYRLFNSAGAAVVSQNHRANFIAIGW